jgi:hypothetical protein
MQGDIAAMMKEMMREMASEYIDLGELDEADLKKWQELSEESARLENEGRILKARGDLFWANIEKKSGQMGKALKIDDGHLYMRREKTIKELQDTVEEEHDPTDI